MMHLPSPNTFTDTFTIIMPSLIAHISCDTSQTELWYDISTVALNCIKEPVYTEAYPIGRVCSYIVGV